MRFDHTIIVIVPKVFEGFCSATLIRRAGRYSGSSGMPSSLVAAQANFYNERGGETLFLDKNDSFWEESKVLNKPAILLGILPTEQILRWVYANRRNISAWIGNRGMKMVRENLPENFQDRIIFEPEKKLVNIVENLLGTSLLPRWAEEGSSVAEELKKLLDCNPWGEVLRAFVIDNSEAWDKLDNPVADLDVIRGWAGRS